MSEVPKRRWFQFSVFPGSNRRWLRRERIALAKQQQGAVPSLHDPIEDDPKFQPMLVEAEALAEAELAERKRGLGFCHRFWATKQRILRERFGIDWFSPADMNPGFRFD